MTDIAASEVIIDGEEDGFSGGSGLHRREFWDLNSPRRLTKVPWVADELKIEAEEIYSIYEYCFLRQWLTEYNETFGPDDSVDLSVLFGSATD